MKILDFIFMMLFFTSLLVIVGSVIAWIWVENDPHHYIGKTMASAGIIAFVSIAISFTLLKDVK